MSNADSPSTSRFLHTPSSSRSSKRKWEPLLLYKRRRRQISTSSVTSFLSSVSIASRREQSPGYFKQLWNDVNQASIWAWLYLMLSETAGMSLGVIILCGTKYVKEVWGFSPSQAALTIVLPQLAVIPVFCLISLIDFPIFGRVIFGNACTAAIALLPFLHHPAGWAVVIFVCELANAIRTSAQMPGFNKLVPAPRIARRFISISTIFIFTMRTLGYSGGSAMFDRGIALPFITSGVCQILAAVLLCLVIWTHFRFHDREQGNIARRESGDFEDVLRKSEVQTLVEECQKSPGSTGSSVMNEHKEMMP